MNGRTCPYDIAASVVLYKTDPAELEAVVQCLMNASLRVKTVIVDNSPTDALRSLCNRLEVEYVFTGKNIGFGAAHNIAINRLSVYNLKYHLVLNPDVVFSPEIIYELFAFLELNKSVGLVMPRVIYPDGSIQKLCKKLPSPFDILVKRLVPSSKKRLFQGSISSYELENMDMARVISVPFLSGCFMFLRISALQKVGLFDERFFIYFEDLDLSRRIHVSYRTVYYPYVTIVHRHEKGSYKSTKLLYCGIISAVRYFNKWGWIRDEQRSLINNSIDYIDNLVQLPDGRNPLEG